MSSLLTPGHCGSVVPCRIRKERRVRPGFTPVEDVVRYRPSKARQADEARRRAIPGRAASPVASIGSTACSPQEPSPPIATTSKTSDTAPTTRHSGVARSSIASDGKSRAQQPRGKFAPLQQTSESRQLKLSATRTVAAPETDHSQQASGSESKSWRNSRLRKTQAPKASLDEATAVSVARDQDRLGDGYVVDRETKDEDQTTAKGKTSAEDDDLASQLHNLRIDLTKEAQK